MKKINKKTSFAFRKNIYLLGRDEDGINYWLEEPTFDCGWYWGLGYIETYTNNRSPQNSKDIQSHEHFISKFLDKGYDTYRNFFKESTLDEKEIWRLLELMSTSYTLEKAARLFEKGSAWVAKNDCYDVIKDQDLYEEIVKVKLPAVNSAICNLLGGNTTPDYFTKMVKIED